MTHPNLLRGLSDMDNAGVYKLTSKLAIIQHIDYFTPIVDDPYTFGQIAVANALSDIYAMGGKPLLALNVVCFPAKTMDISILKEILRGGADKMLEAGVLLVGGHSVEDAEPKYGISITGIVHPKRLITNGNAKAGDRLVLTKPLGIGIISTAIKAGAADKRTIARAVKSMTSLNARAAELMQGIGVHACTDITGFGFASISSPVQYPSSPKQPSLPNRGCAREACTKIESSTRHQSSLPMACQNICRTSSSTRRLRAVCSSR
jgi:selenide,water dikinase